VHRDRLEWLGAGHEAGALPGRSHIFVASGTKPDASPPGGGAPASDVEFMKTDLFDRQGIEAGVLIPLQPVTVGGWTYPDEAAWFVSAWNELMRDRWLSADRRFHLSMVVSPLDPALAAKEIKRFGETPGVVGILLPILNIPFGQRHYYPIFEAAQEAGLPIIQHTSGGFDYVGVTQFAGGLPTHFAERYSLFHQIGQTHLTTMIFEGVFERFPGLKVVFVEYGWTWLAPLLWRMDATWKSARRHHPWMKKSPTEYVLDHVRLTTEPALECPNPEWLRQTIEMMHGDKVLMFSTDYPHWDSEEPTTVLKGVPDAAKRAILRDNAVDFYGKRLRLDNHALIP
jgi:predicted TIM-barrel fold metal-dependent hydrolase